MGTDSLEDAYRTLGLAPGASLKEVQRAYRALVKVWHPDRFTQAPHLQPLALEKIQTINHAYARLRLQQPGRTTPAAPPPLWRWTVQRVRALPIWLVALVAFIMLRLGSAYLAPAPHLMLPHAEQRVEESVRLAPSSSVEGAAATGPSTPAVPAPLTRGHGYFTVGSTKAEVLASQGSPTLASEHVWEYGGSRVYFRHGRVSSWEVWPRSPLKVKLLPALSLEAAPAYFTVGSTKDEVLAVQGTPTRLSDRVWEYSHSRVYFDSERVTRWEEWRGSPLKARYIHSQTADD
jgi:hypothetical protein